MNLEQLPIRILKVTYIRAIELELDEEFIGLIEDELSKREFERKARIETIK
ncbi:sporulation histidine kinase inhibitor Sda [Halobacillus naozhouensis]|uniref:Sporulation histidine kinase inhibitor Sda n=1 Tax=Halobacillus naozhouensis TaxID=554880 RepID=A0ABY8IZF9_9BACI|nr:sporulation histidine kinase inhibitor Sda [Halobacillus naozhouensis]WFT74589.1 sporulation histidine kinase inhibitor Sda [Halobacillus naozhouensis]